MRPVARPRQGQVPHDGWQRAGKTWEDDRTEEREGMACADVNTQDSPPPLGHHSASNLNFPFRGPAAQLKRFWQSNLKWCNLQFILQSVTRGQREQRRQITLRWGTAHCGSNYDGSTSFQTEEKHTKKS